MFVFGVVIGLLGGIAVALVVKAWLVTRLDREFGYDGDNDHRTVVRPRPFGKTGK